MSDKGRVIKKGYSQPSTKAKLSPAKAEKILKDGSVRGHPITSKQRGFFGVVAGKDKGK